MIFLKKSLITLTILALVICVMSDGEDKAVQRICIDILTNVPLNNFNNPSSAKIIEDILFNISDNYMSVAAKSFMDNIKRIRNNSYSSNPYSVRIRHHGDLFFESPNLPNLSQIMDPSFNCPLWIATVVYKHWVGKFSNLKQKYTTYVARVSGNQTIDAVTLAANSYPQFCYNEIDSSNYQTFLDSLIIM